MAELNNKDADHYIVINFRLQLAHSLEQIAWKVWDINFQSNCNPYCQNVESWMLQTALKIRFQMGRNLNTLTCHLVYQPKNLHIKTFKDPLRCFWVMRKNVCHIFDRQFSLNAQKLNFNILRTNLIWFCTKSNIDPVWFYTFLPHFLWRIRENRNRSLKNIDSCFRTNNQDDFWSILSTRVIIKI